MAQPNGNAKAALSYLDAHKDEFQAQLVALSRIPGVSAEPAPNAHLKRSAEATAEVMRAAGIENVQILEIEGVHPYVYGDWLGKPGAPTILLYGHHDVQPEGRPEKWISPPYEPTVRNGRLYGRGTADDKAGVMTHVAAVASYLKSTGELPLNVRFVIEGEEEIGSENLGQFLQTYKHMLPADFIVLSDTANFDTGIPALTYQLRGICTVDVTVQTIAQPVHSGMWGGPVPDPVQVMCTLIAGLQGKKGEINVPGLYKQVAKTGKTQLGRIRKLPFNEAKFKREARMMKGMKLAGEKGFSVYEQLWTRPVAHGHRLRRPPDQGLVEPDHRPRDRASLAAHRAEHGRQGGGEGDRQEADREAALRGEGDGRDRRLDAVVDDRPRGAGVRGRATGAQGRLRQGDGDDRGRRLDRLRRPLRRPARRRAVPAHGRRGPAVQRALREREPAPRRLVQVHEVGHPHVRRALAGADEEALALSSRGASSESGDEGSAAAVATVFAGGWRGTIRRGGVPMPNASRWIASSASGGRPGACASAAREPPRGWPTASRAACRAGRGAVR